MKRLCLSEKRVVLKDFEAQGFIERIKVSNKQIASNIKRAQKDLKTAKDILKIDEEWAYTISYHAMLRAGRALMFSSGYRPKGKDQHKTVVSFSAELLGKDFKSLTDRFNRMRIKRHGFIYEPERPIPYTEAVQSLKSAEKLVNKIIEKIQKSNPQKRLFR